MRHLTAELMRLVLCLQRRRSKLIRQATFFIDTGIIRPDFTRQEICLELPPIRHLVQ
jgi:hypothetical protein